MHGQQAVYLAVLVLPAITALPAYLLSDRKAFRLTLTMMLIETLLLIACFGCLAEIPVGMAPLMKASLRGVSGILALLSAFTLTLNTIYTGSEETGVDHVLNLLLLSGLIGFFSARHTLWIVFFWEASLLTIFYMSYRHGGRVARASMLYLVYTQVAGTLLMAGGLYAYHVTGHLDIGALRALPEGPRVLLGSLWLLAFFVKTPIVPFHAWQPELYRSSPSSVAIASTIAVKMGVYGLMIVHEYLFPGGMVLLAAIALLGGIYAMFRAYSCRGNMKEMGAYISIAHMSMAASVLLYAPGTYALSAALLLMVSHTLSMTGFFAVAEPLRGEKVADNMSKWIVFIAMISVLPLPGLSTFAGELGVLYSLYWAESTTLLALSLTISLLTIGLIGWRAMQFVSHEGDMGFRAGSAITVIVAASTIASLAVGSAPGLLQGLTVL